MLAKKLRAQVELEIELIGRLFTAYSELLQRVRQERPNLIETTALASVLHSFYTGLENVFQAITKELDGNLAPSPQWHRDLLWQIARQTAQRKAVISTETAQLLLPYLTFRHFYRHAYSFFLDWDELAKLVLPLPEVWEQTKQNLEEFLRLSESIPNEPTEL